MPQKPFLLTLLSFIGLLPLGLRRVIGRLIGRAVSFFPTREREIAALHLDLFLAQQGGRKLLRPMYAHLGETVMESLNLQPIISKSDTLVECEGLELFEPLFARGNGLIALVAHVGNWDLLAAYLISKGIPVTTAGRPARRPIIQAALEQLRAAYGVKTIWRGGLSGSRDILHDLKRSDTLVAALVDQDTRVTSVFAPFFGRAVKCPSALVSMGKKNEASFVSTFIFRTEEHRFKIFIKEIDRDLEPAQILAEFNRRLEYYLSLYPEQWVWFHKRWRSLPDGTTMSSKEYTTFLQDQFEHLRSVA